MTKSDPILEPLFYRSIFFLNRRLKIKFNKLFNLDWELWHSDTEPLFIRLYLQYDVKICLKS